MATVDHRVSFRNGPQVMVAGLKLASLGYRRGARVRITDPAGKREHPAWEFVVANDEYATLVSRAPEPPSWIQPGMMIRIEVTAVGETARHKAASPEPAPRTASKPVTATALGEWRRALLRILDEVDGRSGLASESVAARIRRLSDAGRIPRNMAAYMRSVTESRNVTEYDAKVLAAHEAEAVTAAWRAVEQWAKEFAETRQRARG